MCCAGGPCAGSSSGTCLVKANLASLKEVVQAAWCGNNNLAAVAQLAQLPALGCATIHTAAVGHADITVTIVRGGMDKRGHG